MRFRAVAINNTAITRIRKSRAKLGVVAAVVKESTPGQDPIAKHGAGCPDPRHWSFLKEGRYFGGSAFSGAAFSGAAFSGAAASGAGAVFGSGYPDSLLKALA